jgi:16S rRNA (cytosine967-C5)-methyltransferase
MKPNARIAAAIEILDEIFACAGSADLVLRRYLRPRRYIGSKDRAGIQALVFDVVRRRGELMWRLGPDNKSSRLTMIAKIALDGVDDPSAVFDGEGYGPSPLTTEEQAFANALKTNEDEQPPDWARLNYPLWLNAELRSSLGENFETEMQALNVEAPVDVRVNTLIATREETLQALKEQGLEVEATPYSPLGIRFAKRIPWGNLPHYKAGAVEPQDEGSQLLAMITDAHPGQTVVDLCAGAGGKTLALAAAMKGEGRLCASDVAPDRLARSQPRLDRSGVGNAELIDDAERLHQEIDGKADRVLADMPCSGSGAWRRQPAARWCLTTEDLDTYRLAQREILERAAKLVKVGGRLIYATCSLLVSENEVQAEAFSAANPEFKLLDAAQVWRDCLNTDAPFAGPYLKVTPAAQNTDGVFAAIWERT